MPLQHYTSSSGRKKWHSCTSNIKRESVSDELHSEQKQQAYFVEVSKNHSANTLYILRHAQIIRHTIVISCTIFQTKFDTTLA